MEFGSRYVYDYAGESEEEYFSDEELTTPMQDRQYAEVQVAPADTSAPAAPQAQESSSADPADDAPLAAAAPYVPEPRRGLLGRLADRVLGRSTDEPARSAPSRGADLRPDSYRRLHERRVRAVRRADTNIVAIKFNTLTAPSHMHTGDAVTCLSCHAVLSQYSKLQSATTGVAAGDAATADKIWNCELCGTPNPVDIVEEEIPTSEDVTYMISPAPATTSSLAAEQGGAIDQSIIVFCVDVSGSMCVTTEVPGRFQLRGGSVSSPGHIAGDSGDQYMPGQRRNVTYVSRLQAMQAAVDDQLQTMKEKFPERRAALIAFNNEVKIIGTTEGDDVVVCGDKLNNKDTLVDIGKVASKPGAVKDVVAALSDRLFRLEEDGATALGPALLVGIALAGQVSGSKVIICTDGLANIGLGNLEGITPDSPDKMQKAQEFYTQCSDLAVEKGVSVSVVTLEGNRCRTLELGSVAGATGGAIDTVDPLHLTERFGSILSNPVIATNVTAKLLLHRKLYVRFLDKPDDRSQSFAEQHVGNVTKETEITFEFGVKPKKTNEGKSKKKKKNKEASEEKEEAEVALEAASKEETSANASEVAEGGDDAGKTEATGEPTADGGAAEASAAPSHPPPPPLMIDGKENLPFQLLITYTSREGAESMRIITRVNPITKSRGEAERDIQMDVVGTHAAQRSSKAAIGGEYTTSRVSNLCRQRLLARNVRSDTGLRQYQQYVTTLGRFDDQILGAQEREVRTHGATYSDTEMEMDGDDEDIDLMIAPSSGALPGSLPAPAAAAAVAAADIGSDDDSSGDEGESREKKKKAKKPTKKNKAKQSSRHAECEDETANFAYKMRAANTNLFS